MVRFVFSEGQSKRMWNKSQGLSVRGKVQSGELFKSNLYTWASKNEWPVR